MVDLGRSPDRRAGGADAVLFRDRAGAAAGRSSRRSAWRGGIDLNPLDVESDDDMSWLLTLVWPEHDDRRAQLANAIEIARADPPDLRRGDLVEMLPALVDEAAAAVGPDGVVVVFHSAVIAYLDDPARGRFARPDGRPGRGRPVPVGQQRGRATCFRTSPRPGPSLRPVSSCSASTAASLGHTHGHGRTLHWW